MVIYWCAGTSPPAVPGPAERSVLVRPDFWLRTNILPLTCAGGYERSLARAPVAKCDAEETLFGGRYGAGQFVATRTSE